MRFWSWLRGEPRREYYYKKRLQEIKDHIGYDTPKDPVKKWISEFNDEETLGFAIIQRQRRLENEKKTAEEQQQREERRQFRRRRCEQCRYQEEMCSACHEATQAADVPPPYSSRSPEDFKQDLAKLREEFVKNRIRLEAIKQKLTDSRSWWVTYAMAPRWHRDDTGRTFKWIEGRRKCADLGGCCGRTCGCCEKVLIEYQRPKFWRKTHSKTVPSSNINNSLNGRQTIVIVMAEAVDANATLSFWQKLDPSHARWLFLAVFVIVICNVLFGAVRLYLELLIKRHHIEKLRAMPPSRRRDVEMGHRFIFSSRLDGSSPMGFIGVQGVLETIWINAIEPFSIINLILTSPCDSNLRNHGSEAQDDDLERRVKVYTGGKGDKRR
ncbi:hypothetical protein An17g00610 [Aspergillus niger]|uniref:Uncharacterized protein n=2 Tax=Aspergillus niger TaxID=5061 RepID=A2R998_ASPNC|nr:hypothetical protein An17g00610 [Aspergillus niger]CAK42989.1 hypothetical protein An17g00610 [Aspergillus niger]